MPSARELPTALLLIDIQQGFLDPAGTRRPPRSTPSFESNVAALLAAARAWNDGQGKAKEHHPVVIIHVHHHSTDPASTLHPSHRWPAAEAGAGVGEVIESPPSVTALACAAPAPDGSEVVLTKNRNSAFVGTDLEARLRAAGIRQLIVTGLTTEHCVSTSVRMAANLQVLGDRNGADGSGEGVNNIVLVSDATASYGTSSGSGVGPYGSNDGVDGKRNDDLTFDADTVHHVSLATLRDEFAAVRSTAQVLSDVFAQAK